MSTRDPASESGTSPDDTGRPSSGRQALDDAAAARLADEAELQRLRAEQDGPASEGGDAPLR